MAEVDFSNARIEPVAYPGIGQNPFASYSAINPTGKANVSLAMSANLWNASSTSITTGATQTRLVNESKQLTYLYQGTFNASGTEFYIIYYGSNTMGAWKVLNISFNSEDTYVFQINADLVCN